MNLPPSYTGVYMLRWHNEECVVCCPRGTALQEEHQSVEKDFTFYQQGRHFLHWFWFQSQGLTGSGLRLRVASLGSIYLLMFEAINQMQSCFGQLSPHQRQYLHTLVYTFRYTSCLHSDTNILLIEPNTIVTGRTCLTDLR